MNTDDFRAFQQATVKGQLAVFVNILGKQPLQALSPVEKRNTWLFYGELLHRFFFDTSPSGDVGEKKKASFCKNSARLANLFLCLPYTNESDGVLRALRAFDTGVTKCGVANGDELMNTLAQRVVRDWPAGFSTLFASRSHVEDFLAHAATKPDGHPLRDIAFHMCNRLSEDDVLSGRGRVAIRNLEVYLPFLDCAVTEDKWRPHLSHRIEQWVEERLVQQQRDRLEKSLETEGRVGVVRKL